MFAYFPENMKGIAFKINCKNEFTKHFYLNVKLKVTNKPVLMCHSHYCQYNVQCLQYKKEMWLNSVWPICQPLSYWGRHSGLMKRKSPLFFHHVEAANQVVVQNSKTCLACCDTQTHNWQWSQLLIIYLILIYIWPPMNIYFCKKTCILYQFSTVLTHRNSARNKLSLVVIFPTTMLICVSSFLIFEKKWFLADKCETFEFAVFLTKFSVTYWQSVILYWQCTLICLFSKLCQFVKDPLCNGILFLL